jgi:MarR family transcriptional regulator, multiple antibiotic resistance protein MarR
MASPQALEALIPLIFKTERLLRDRAHGDRIDPFTVIRLETLRHIAEAGNPTMKEIAGNLKVTAPSATSVVSGLVKAGLVVRKESAGDRRVVRLALTAKGRRALDDGFRYMSERMKEVLAPLTDDEVKSLAAIFRRLAEANGPAQATGN